MSNSTDPKLIQFLTNPENLGCVLEVLKHGEAVRDTLTKRFWDELRTHLNSTAPGNIGKRLAWHLESWQEGKRTYSCLDAKLPQFTKEEQNLFYRVEYYAWSKGLQLYYGLHWNKQISRSNSISLEPLQTLRPILESEGYDMTELEWWFGWKFIRNFTSTEDFLSEFVESPKLLLEAISGDLWPFLQRTIKHVEAVNRTLNT